MDKLILFMDMVICVMIFFIFMVNFCCVCVDIEGFLYWNLWSIERFYKNLLNLIDVGEVELVCLLGCCKVKRSGEGD